MLAWQDFPGLILAPLLEQSVTLPNNCYNKLFVILSDDVLAHKLMENGVR